MAFLVMGSPMMVQLHCKGPTGKVSRISAGFGTVMGNPEESMACPGQNTDSLTSGFYVTRRYSSPGQLFDATNQKSSGQMMSNVMFLVQNSIFVAVTYGKGRSALRNFACLHLLVTL
jgi:hypothetical protein